MGHIFTPDPPENLSLMDQLLWLEGQQTSLIGEYDASDLPCFDIDTGCTRQILELREKLGINDAVSALARELLPDKPLFAELIESAVSEPRGTEKIIELAAKIGVKNPLFEKVLEKFRASPIECESKFLRAPVKSPAALVEYILFDAFSRCISDLWPDSCVSFEWNAQPREMMDGLSKLLEVDRNDPDTWKWVAEWEAFMKWDLRIAGSKTVSFLNHLGEHLKSKGKALIQCGQDDENEYRVFVIDRSRLSKVLALAEKTGLNKLKVYEFSSENV